MKPIIVKPNEEGLICFTEEELQKLIDDVYAQGKADSTTYIPYGYPSNNLYNPLTYVTWDGTKTAPVPFYRDEWTCAGNTATINTGTSTKTVLNEDKGYYNGSK